MYQTHGTKVKGCSSDRCTNQVVRGGVRIRLGAKVEHKRCISISQGCTDLAQEEECALGMGQSVKYAALKDARINPKEEENYVLDTMHIAIPLMNLQLSHHVLDQKSIRLH